MCLMCSSTFGTGCICIWESMGMEVRENWEMDKSIVAFGLFMEFVDSKQNTE